MAREQREQEVSPLRRRWKGKPSDVPKDLDGAYRVNNRLDGRKPPKFEDPK